MPAQAGPGRREAAALHCSVLLYVCAGSHRAAGRGGDETDETS